jgi:hypothetical protein
MEKKRGVPIVQPVGKVNKATLPAAAVAAAAKKPRKSTKGARRRTRISEYNLQRACVNYLKHCHPAAYKMSCATAGGSMSRSGGKIMKATGYRKGVPDLHIYMPSGKWASAFFELKTRTGTLSPEQKVWGVNLTHHGFYYAVIRSIEEFTKHMEIYTGHIPKVSAAVKDARSPIPVAMRPSKPRTPRKVATSSSASSASSSSSKQKKKGPLAAFFRKPAAVAVAVANVGKQAIDLTHDEEEEEEKNGDEESDDEDEAMLAFVIAAAEEEESDEDSDEEYGSDDGSDEEYVDT